MRIVRKAILTLGIILGLVSFAAAQGAPNIQNWTAQPGYATSIQNQINQLKNQLGPAPSAGNAGDFLMSNGVIANYYAMTGDISCSTTVPGLCTVNSISGFTPQTFPLTNASVTGTTLNLLVKLTGNPSTGVVGATTDTTGEVGICIKNCGTTGIGTIQYEGIGPCIFDGPTIAGDAVTISSSIGGNCHDSGSALPTNATQPLGFVLSTNGSGGTYQMYLSAISAILPAPQTVPVVCSQLPALTGDTTSSSGSCATITGGVQGNSLAPNRVATSGSTLSVNLATSLNQFITLNDTITLSFSSPPADGNIVRFKLTQSNSGSHTITWPSNVKWPSAVAPTLTTTTGQADFVQCLYDGTTTNYACSSVLNFAS